MNTIIIAGQLGKDAEIRHLSDGSSVAGFSVADQQGRDKPTIWWNCSLFGKRAESLAQYLTKGQSVTVSGTLTEREYTNRNGVKTKAQDIRVNDVALQGGQRQQEAAPMAALVPRPTPKPAPNFSDMDDDIPF